MRKNKMLVLIPLMAMITSSAKVFLGKGINSGVGNWRFYASLVGFLISILFLLFVLFSWKNNIKE